MYVCLDKTILNTELNVVNKWKANRAYVAQQQQHIENGGNTERSIATHTPHNISFISNAYRYFFIRMKNEEKTHTHLVVKKHSFMVVYG